MKIRPFAGGTWLAVWPVAMKKVTVSARARWLDLVEACHAPAAYAAQWAVPIIDAARHLFQDAASVMIDVADLPPPAPTDRVHVGPTVLTHRDMDRTLPKEIVGLIEEMRARPGVFDGISLVAQPLPGRFVLLQAVYHEPIELPANARKLLMRAALHLETSYRARHRPESVCGELDGHGQIVWRDGNTTAHELWSALAAGKISLVPVRQRHGTRYLFVANPPATQGQRTLTGREQDAVSLAVRGFSVKLTMHTLGVAAATASQYLASAAAKLGLTTRLDLVRVAAILTRESPPDLPGAILTEAERDVLVLLERGLTNAQIAAMRSRSVRTVANQVASLLRKTSSPSRRALVAGCHGLQPS